MANIIHRRDFLRGLGAGMFLLNPIISMLARAQAGGVAKRFIYMFSANGTVLENWYGSGNANPGSLNLANSQILSPLNSFKNKITLIQGVDNNIGGPGDDHVRECLSSLTAIENNEGSVYTVNSPTGYNKGKSIDQYIADYYNQKAVVAGVQSGGFQGGFFSLISSKGSNKPVVPESNPANLHNSMFTGVVPAGQPVPTLSDNDVNNVRRKSILDFAIDDMARLKSRLPAALATKLQDHADSIRDLEKSIVINPPDSGGGGGGPEGCSIPSVGSASNYDSNSEYPAAVLMQMKNIVYAMACGRTNSAVIVCGYGVDLHSHSWLSINDEHHTISHLTDGTAKEKLTKINNWYAGRFNDLLTLLNQVPENGGTMLDNSLVVWGNELSAGANHSHKNLPYVLAGGAGGKLPGGRDMNFGGRGHGELLVSIANAMGIPISSYNTGSKALNGLIV